MRVFVTSLVLLTLSLTSMAKSQGFKKSEGFVYIPVSTIDYNDITASVEAFYMLDHEVTNLEYKTFLKDLKAQGREEDIQQSIPDTAAWNTLGWYNEPMCNMYFWHPAYDNYPVVNVPAKGVELYCAWLTEKFKAKYGSATIQPFRVPTKYEWAAAAMGGETRVVYSWGTNKIRCSKGCYMANFRPLGDEFITIKDSVPAISKDQSAFYGEDGAFMTASVKSYFANAYGLYNMCGNVSELVTDSRTHNLLDQPQDAPQTATESYYIAIGGNWNSTGYDIRITSEIAFEKANPFVGFRPVMSHMTTAEDDL